MDLIHYGSSAFDPERFIPIQDLGSWGKPKKGGLWASPVSSEWGWKEWCLEEHFNVSKLESSFEFSIDGNILVIDSIEDLDHFYWVDNSVLFEPLVREGIDAVYLTYEGQWKTRFSIPHSLYGWDCESVLIMNPDCIEVINESLPSS